MQKVNIKRPGQFSAGVTCSCPQSKRMSTSDDKICPLNRYPMRVYPYFFTSETAKWVWGGYNSLMLAAQGDAAESAALQHWRAAESWTPTGLRVSRIGVDIALATSVHQVRVLRDKIPEYDEGDYGYRYILKDLAHERIVYLWNTPMDPDSIEWFYRHAPCFSLLRLPLELRRQVYDLLLPPSAKRQGYSLGMNRCRNTMEVVRQPIPPLALVNRQINAEILGMVYLDCVFSAWTIPGVPHRVTKEHGFYDFMPPYAYKTADSVTTRVRNWSLSVLHFKAGSPDLSESRRSVEAFCKFLQGAGRLTETVMVELEGHNEGREIWAYYDQAELARKCARDWSVSVEHPRCDISYACQHLDKAAGRYCCRECRYWAEASPHLNCMQDECFWIPKTTWKHSRKDQAVDLTDIEYVLQPLQVLRGLTNVRIHLPRQLRSNPRTVAFKENLEALMTSDDESDLKETSRWHTLAEAARVSAFCR